MTISSGSGSRAIEGLDHLSAVLDATLDTAEAEAGALRLNRRPLDLTTLAGELVELYLPAAEESGLVMRLRTQGPVRVEADEGLLRRAITNLLDNALTHLPAGCAVEVAVIGDEHRAVVTVSDDGPGFPEEVRDRPFERFVHGARSPGSGLGLAMVRAVAHVHGGSARLVQPLSGGSAIEIEIPAGESDSLPAPQEHRRR